MNDLQTLKEQRVLFLGGSGAMGQAVARLAHQHGAQVTTRQCAVPRWDRDQA